MSDEDEIKKALFAIYSEVDGIDKPIVMTNLSFARIIDDIVIPFETGKAFFVDGVPVLREKIRRIKIIRETHGFRDNFKDLHHKLRKSTLQEKKDISEQYNIRIEALLRESGEDVTSQVIKAFDTTIRPKLRDYLPNRALC